MTCENRNESLKLSSYTNIWWGKIWDAFLCEFKTTDRTYSFNNLQVMSIILTNNRSIKCEIYFKVTSINSRLVIITVRDYARLNVYCACTQSHLIKVKKTQLDLCVGYINIITIHLGPLRYCSVKELTSFHFKWQCHSTKFFCEDLIKRGNLSANQDSSANPFQSHVHASCGWLSNEMKRLLLDQRWALATFGML